jgi:hypothetical protein
MGLVTPAGCQHITACHSTSQHVTAHHSMSQHITACHSTAHHSMSANISSLRLLASRCSKRAGAGAIAAAENQWVLSIHQHIFLANSSCSTRHNSNQLHKMCAVRPVVCFVTLHSGCSHHHAALITWHCPNCCLPAISSHDGSVTLHTTAHRQVGPSASIRHRAVLWCSSRTCAQASSVSCGAVAGHAVPMHWHMQTCCAVSGSFPQPNKWCP